MKNPKILIVDDANFMRTLLGNIVKDAGFENLYYAESGERALEQVAEIQPDLITLDISMPGIDGLDVIPKILEISPNAKIIMVSAVTGDFAIKQAIMRGAADFVTKPFDKDTIHSMLNKHLA